MSGTTRPPIPKRLGEDLLIPGYMNNPFALVTHPSPSLPMVNIAGRGISIAVDCTLLQKYVSWQVVPRTANPCPQPPTANPCGGDPPSCQALVNSAGCTPVITPGPPCLLNVSTCIVGSSFVPPPCFTPCGVNPSPPPAMTCTSCVYPTCLTFGSCLGGSVICGPAGPVTGLGVANCNPLAFRPACQDGCIPVGPPIPNAAPALSASGLNISLTALASQTISPQQMLADPSLPQWIPSPYCDKNVCAIIPTHLSA